MAGPKISLKDLWNRDKRRCWICQRSVRFIDATRDHVVPVSLGGSHAQSNLRLAHEWCNSARGNQVSAILQSDALEAMQERVSRSKLAALLLSYRAQVLQETATLLYEHLHPDARLRPGVEAACELLENSARILVPLAEDEA